MKLIPLLFILVPLMIACSSGPPTPTPDEKPVTVTHIWLDYQDNEARANQTWKGKWLYLEMSVVDQVESGGRIEMFMDGIGFRKAIFNYSDKSDVLGIDRLDNVVAYCKLGGLQLDLWLTFDSCRPVEKPTTTVADYIEWCADLDDLDEDVTWAQLTRDSGYLLRQHEDVEAPPKLEEYHQARIRLLEEIYSTADDKPAHEPVIIEELTQDRHFSNALEVAQKVEKDLSQEIKFAMQEGRCR